MALAGERTICVKTLSKAYGLAGLRAGYGVASPSLVLEVDKARGPFVVTSVTSAAAAAAISSDVALAGRHDRRNEGEPRARAGRAAPPRVPRYPRSASNFVFILREEERARRRQPARLERVRGSGASLSTWPATALGERAARHGGTRGTGCSGYLDGLRPGPPPARSEGGPRGRRSHVHAPLPRRRSGAVRPHRRIATNSTAATKRRSSARRTTRASWPGCCAT